MAESRLSPQVEGDDHEEGEISDEEPLAPSSANEEQVESLSRAEDDESPVEPAVATSVAPSSFDRDPPLLLRRASLDDLRELGELKAGQVRKPTDFYRGRAELESISGEEGAKRHGRGSQDKPWQRRDVSGNVGYGSNLYNFAWAQAVSGAPRFSPKEPSAVETSSKQSGERVSSSGSPGLGAWSLEGKRKVSLREFISRDSEVYRRAEKSLEEREEGMSPTRENGSSRNDRLTEGGWGGRIREAKRAERPLVAVKSRIESTDREMVERDEKGDCDGEDDRSRKQRSESQSSNGRLDELESGARNSTDTTVQSGQNSEQTLEAEDREEGELEEGEIELGSSEAPASPSKDYNRQSKYNGNKGIDYWVKDKTNIKSASSKTLSRSQVEDYPSRRGRQIKSLESHREKSLAFASDLVKNVTVKDAQKSFVDVCGRLHKALRVLGELLAPRASSQVEEGRRESPPREVSALARQAFAGIRAVYAVRNTASGREQERDKNIFPRLLEYANGFSAKLFTRKQTRELEVMMQTIATAGRFVRDGVEKGQYPREHQFQPEAKKSKENDVKQSDVMGNNTGNGKQSNSTDSKGNTDSSVAGRGVLGFVDSKQAEEAAAIAAAALAYAQSSDAARANSLFGSSYGSRPSGTPISSTVSWGWSPENPSQGLFTDSGFSSLPTGSVYNPPSIVKHPVSQYQSIKLGQNGYAGHIVEARPDTQGTDPSAPNGAKVQEDLGAPPGYPKPASTFGMLEDDWEELSPPGAGTSSYAPVPDTSVSTAAVPIIGAKDETSIGQVWQLRPEVGTVTHYHKGRGATSLYSLERMPSPTHPKSRGTSAPLYAVDRLPSPTPDEDDDVPVAPRPSLMEAKPAPRLAPMDTTPVLLDADSAKSGIQLPLQRVGKFPVSNVLAGSVPQLIQAQSLDVPLSHIEPNVQENPADVMLIPSSSRLSDDTEAVKVSTYPPKGNFRSRDPRRRLQNHSLDMADMFGAYLNSQLTSVPNLNLEEAHFGNYRNRKRPATDIDDKQEVGTEKRQKAQSEVTFEANDFTNGSIQLSGGTGGWLDDNAVPLFGTEEGPKAMEVDDNGLSPGLEEMNAVGDLHSNGEDRSENLLEYLNSVGSNQTQKIDPGQLPSETGQRKMKPRDPRRVLLETNVERGDSSSREVGDSMEMARKGETGSSLIVVAEPANWNKTGNNQESIQGPSLPNISSHFMEKLTSLAGIVGGTSVSGSPPHNQLPGQGGGTQVTVVAGGTQSSAGSAFSGDVEAPRIVEVASVAVESIPQRSQEHINEKLTVVNNAPRKPKGSPSQWGTSQVHPDLEQLLGDLTEEHRRSVQLERERRMEEQDRMFSEGKLCLVLDLDHTLLNSAKFSEIEPEWEMRLRVAEAAERSRTNRDGLERRELYRFPHMSMWTKLRPGIWKFLARASQLYELHVYTMGNKVYATEMAKLLDPTGKLFAGRVISKGDDGDGDDLLPKSKDLDGVLGMESAVLIVDDSARVWPHHSHNLIVVERYMYFPCSRRQFGLTGPSLLEVGHDERESDGMLASALGVIDRIHQSFFQHLRLREIDVREILAAQQRQVLAGCKVVFSRVFPVGEAEPQRHPLWRTAEQFGAICTIAIDEQVTHVVAISLGTDKVNWALETGRYVVRPAWLEASTILYRRANERDFPVQPK